MIPSPLFSHPCVWQVFMHILWRTVILGRNGLNPIFKSYWPLLQLVKYFYMVQWTEIDLLKQRQEHFMQKNRVSNLRHLHSNTVPYRPTYYSCFHFHAFEYEVDLMLIFERMGHHIKQWCLLLIAESSKGQVRVNITMINQFKIFF